MRLFNRKPESAAPGTDQIAARIANHIIKWQLALSRKVNKQVNRYTKACQKRLLWIFCAAWAVVIGLNFFQSRKKAAMRTVEPNYLPAHIGRPSDIPEPSTKLKKRTDSLTIKN
jgi:hypothetical protein